MRPFIVTFLGRKCKPARPIFPLEAPHIITLAGYFTVLTVNFGSNGDAVLERRTIFGIPLTSLKVLSSHFSPFCSHPISIFLEKTDPFFLHCRSEHGLLGCTARLTKIFLKSMLNCLGRNVLEELRVHVFFNSNGGYRWIRQHFVFQKLICSWRSVLWFARARLLFWYHPR